MESSRTATIIVLALSLAVQGLNLASRGFFYKNAKDIDSQSSNPTTVDTNQGYIDFGIAAAAISAGFYIILLISKIIRKSLGELLDFLLFESALLLQFAFATSIVVQLRNAATAINTAFAQLDALEAAGSTSNSVSLLRTFVSI
jgi:hypothetical protein